MASTTNHNSKITAPSAFLSLVLFVITAIASSDAATTNPKNMSIMHPAFESVGKSAGLQIWRIEGFEPVPYHVNNYGIFYTGDSYIVANSIEDKSKSNKLSSDIYYWLGSYSSQDEVAAAAYLSLQLDNALGGSPVQHKETQEHESRAFLDLFKPSIRYLPGGVISDINNADINAGGEKRLYQIKGKKNIGVKQVELNVTSMNQGDCFILISGYKIFVYLGLYANDLERLKTSFVVKQIKDEDYTGLAYVYTIDSLDSLGTPDEYEKFFKELGSGSIKEIPAAMDDDQEFDKKETASPILYKISDAQGGKISSESIIQKSLVLSYLKTDDCFILDTVSSKIYVWIGRKSTVQEIVESLYRAKVIIKENKYPAWTRVIRVIEGHEPIAFKQYFDGWKDKWYIHL